MEHAIRKRLKNLQDEDDEILLLPTPKEKEPNKIYLLFLMFVLGFALFVIVSFLLG